MATQALELTVLATDISDQAVAVASENAQSNGVADRVRCRVSDLLTLPEDCRDLAPFEVITANPPYVAKNQMISETVRHEPPIAIWGGKEGMDFIGPILAAAPALLRPAALWSWSSATPWPTPSETPPSRPRPSTNPESCETTRRSSGPWWPCGSDAAVRRE